MRSSSSSSTTASTLDLDYKHHHAVDSGNRQSGCRLKSKLIFKRELSELTQQELGEVCVDPPYWSGRMVTDE